MVSYEHLTTNQLKKLLDSKNQKLSRQQILSRLYSHRSRNRRSHRRRSSRRYSYRSSRRYSYRPRRSSSYRYTYTPKYYAGATYVGHTPGGTPYYK